jgi:2-C-methyl-D-erythritol 4-phosphate cytidylyltransferase
MRVSAILVAAGSGMRLGLDAPKAFVPLGGRSLLYYSLRAMAALDAIGEVVVTVPAGMEQRARAEVERAGLEIPFKLVAGGTEDGAIAAIAVADTLKRTDGRMITGTVARAGLWQAQTPQAFRRVMLIEAHDRAMRERWTTTDDAELVERCGGRLEVVESSATNFKITTPADLEIAEALMARNSGH